MNNTILVSASREYKIHCGGGILESALSDFLSSARYERILIVTDTTVDSFYGVKVLNLLKHSGRECFKFAFPPGEAHKTLKTVAEILEYAASCCLTRGDLIIALGGGIVGDVGGFCAASYLRGIDFIQIPTTFLAAIDSSVGGKTGVNLALGKNLAGAFYQPREVICDTDFFKTLSGEIFACGTSEAIKYGAVFDREFFYRFDGDFQSDISDIVLKCIKFKADVVKNDEFDRGERQLLNFGHTIGHAVEKCSSFKISHGAAVAIGMAAAARAADKLGFSKEPCGSEIVRILEKNNLPIECPFSSDELLGAILLDKKRAGNKLTLVLPEKIGKCVLHPISLGSLHDFLKNAV